MIRWSYEDGKTAFVLSQAPRLVINDVIKKPVGIIGAPMPLILAFNHQKYDNI